MRAELLLSAALLALCACASSGHESLRETARSGWFTVHALDRATAERVLAECQELAPLVLDSPGCGPGAPVELYCVPVERDYGEGRNLTAGDPELREVECIEIDIGRELAWERFVIAHELLHAWLAPQWNELPQILEEGLADLAAVHADPEAGVCRRLFHGLRLVTWAGMGWPFHVEREGRLEVGMLHMGATQKGLPTLEGMLELDGTSYHEVGGEQNENLLYSVGFALVQQIGPPKLERLCAHARDEGLAQIPADWVLEAAGLTRETDQAWAISGQRLIGEPEERMLEQCLRDQGRFRFRKE